MQRNQFEERKKEKVMSLTTRVTWFRLHQYGSTIELRLHSFHAKYGTPKR
jgi:hypothetical protein